MGQNGPNMVNVCFLTTDSAQYHSARRFILQTAELFQRLLVKNCQRYAANGDYFVVPESCDDPANGFTRCSGHRCNFAMSQRYNTARLRRSLRGLLPDPVQQQTGNSPSGTDWKTQ